MVLAITNCDSSPPVAETQRKSYYKENGCVHAAGLLPARLVDVLASAIDTHLHSMLSPRADVTEHDGGKKFTMDYCNYHKISAYQTIAEFLAPMAAELMNSKTVRVYQDQIIVKEAGTLSCPTIWHSDTPYCDVEGSQTINAWIPVDPVPRLSTLEFVAGSHLQGPFIPRSYKTNEPLFEVPGGVDIPPINEDRESYQIRGWDMQPGDVAFHSLSTLHGSASGSRDGRRVLALRFIGDDVRVVKKDHFVVSSLANKSFEGRDFPKVWPKE